MSSKLSTFFHQNRLKTATVQLNVAHVRKSIDELIHLLFPERMCEGEKTIEDIDASISALKKSFGNYFESVSVLAGNTEAKSSANVEVFFDRLPKLAEVLDLDAMDGSS